MISNPAFLFGFYSRRVITGRKPYKRLPGNDGKDVTFHIKTTLIPSQTSNTPFYQTHPTAAISLPSLWGSGTPSTHTQGGSNPPLLQCRLGGNGPWGEDAGSPSTSPPAAGATEAGQEGSPREDGGSGGVSSEAEAGLLLVQSNAAPWCADLLREIPGFRHVNSPRVTL